MRLCFPDTAEPEPNPTRCCAFVARRCATGATTLRRVRRGGGLHRWLKRIITSENHGGLTFRIPQFVTVAADFVSWNHGPMHFSARRMNFNSQDMCFCGRDGEYQKNQLRIGENLQEMSRLESRLSFPNLIHPARNFWNFHMGSMRFDVSNKYEGCYLLFNTCFNHLKNLLVEWKTN